MARDLVCFSHLRWDFVYQRPNHLMARAAGDRRVFFVEEPAETPARVPHLTSVKRDGVTVVTPHLPSGLTAAQTRRTLAGLMDDHVAAERIRRPVHWYYTPMALPWTRRLDAAAVVYDCMDYLAGFMDAPKELLRLEAELLDVADLVFCGGRSLHERMQHRHSASHCFPSSVDVAHFAMARARLPEPADARPIAGPRIGYAGVIDERIDLPLIDGVAAARPDWQIVLVGPIAKIDPGAVPNRTNIHRLGLKTYAELPAYLGSWDVGWMPFARNAATRYISPTKTPEYLAAGLPVVSTSIRDVVDPYGQARLVTIADTVDATIAAIERALAGDRPEQAEVDRFLASRSWDQTWAGMAGLVDRLDAPGAAIPVRAEAPPLARPFPGLPSAPSRQVARGSVAGRSVASSSVAGAGAGAREG